MFLNEPLTDFTVRANRDALAGALETLDERIKNNQLKAHPIINGEKVVVSERAYREDPSNPEIVLGEAFYADLPEVDTAIQSMSTDANSWAEASFIERAVAIENVGKIMRDRKLELTAIIIRESGKPWKEADADVAEAIDFCIYYAAEMRRLGPPIPTSDIPGEENQYLYQPRGIALIIAPWNFPLAIPCGMTVAALVTGNRTILKPAEQTSLIAYEFARILLEAGVHPGGFALLPGRGEIIGKALVEHPAVDVICFTGSKDVGLRILRTASIIPDGQFHVKRVIAEMGGKNAIIVDSDADFDEAIKGVLYSAFGYSGQKCSACSRVIVVGDAYEGFVNRLSEAAGDVLVGDAKSPATFLGPVIDREAQQRILRTIEAYEEKHMVAHKGAVPAVGYFVPPTIFRDVSSDSTLWKEEIFGPVLACCKAKTFNEAIELAVSSQYALTGAVFSRNPENISLAKKKFLVGNLYINRGSTGALVGRQPFGGFKMSGVGSKAGGCDYLTQFMEPRTITENTVRRGFAPE